MAEAAKGSGGTTAVSLVFRIPELPVAVKDAGRGKSDLFPVRLYRDDVAIPPWLSNLQTARLWDYDGVDGQIDAPGGRLKASAG